MPSPPPTLSIDPSEPTRPRVLVSKLADEELFVPVLRVGTKLGPVQPRETARRDPTVRRLVNRRECPVGLSAELYAERLRLIQQARDVRVLP